MGYRKKKMPSKPIRSEVCSHITRHSPEHPKAFVTLTHLEDENSDTLLTEIQGIDSEGHRFEELYIATVEKGTTAIIKDKVHGGVADGLPDSMFKDLSTGIKVEMEHTNDPAIAKEITKDHIVETGDIGPDGKYRSEYYPELSRMERKLKKHD